MASMRSHTQKIRNQIDAGNMGRLADEVLKAAVANHGFWGDDWVELFDTLRNLPVEERQPSSPTRSSSASACSARSRRPGRRC